MMKRPSLLWGALIGGLMMAPLVAVSYLGQQVARLAFVPFDLFDWMARNLPAPLIQVGRGTVEEIVASLQFGNSSDNAKTTENILGVVLVIVIGVIAGALFFLLMNRLKADKHSVVPGLILGLIVALPFIAFSLSVNLDTQAAPINALVWIVALFALWGWAVGWSYDRLSPAVPKTETQIQLQAIDRRSFLIQMGAGAAVVTVAGAGLASILSPTTDNTPASVAQLPESTPDPNAPALPNAGDPVQPAPGTRPEVTPLADHYRIDIASSPNGIVIDPEGYTLPFISEIEGEGEIASLTLDDIRNNFEAVEAYITMSCISNRVGGDLISSLKWTGARMQDVLASMDVPARATHLKIYGGDTFDETVSLELIANDPRILLCYDWADQPLTNKHGFPLRIHIPDLYGMKQPKWITRIEFIEGDQDGYWVRRGWDKVARARATSVIDTVAVDDVYTNADGAALIPVGGIAWAGARGISKVEVRVDNGAWTEAALRAPINDRTWSIWRYDWPFVEGDHTFEVRCFEADGTPQIDARANVAPSGATGLHSVRQTVDGIAAIVQPPPPI